MHQHSSDPVEEPWVQTRPVTYPPDTALDHLKRGHHAHNNASNSVYQIYHHISEGKRSKPGPCYWQQHLALENKSHPQTPICPTMPPQSR